MKLFIGSRRMAYRWGHCNACSQAGRVARMKLFEAPGSVGVIAIDVCSGCALDMVEAAAKKRRKTR